MTEQSPSPAELPQVIPAKSTLKRWMAFDAPWLHRTAGVLKFAFVALCLLQLMLIANVLVQSFGRAGWYVGLIISTGITFGLFCVLNNSERRVIALGKEVEGTRAILAELIDQKEQLAQQAVSLFHRVTVIGALEHTALQDNLTREIDASRRTGFPISLLAVSFVREGDAPLSLNDVVQLDELTAALRKRFRASDIIGRLNATTMAVMLHNANIDQAEEVCQKWMLEVEQELHCRLAAGLVEVDSDRDSARSCIDNSLRALSLGELHAEPQSLHAGAEVRTATGLCVIRNPMLSM